MNTPEHTSRHKQRGLESALLRASQALALAGGAILMLLALITVYSIVGRSLIRTELGSSFLLSWWRPVRGDFELIELGTAVAIASFFPYCQMVRGNVVVDFFTYRAHPRAKAVMAVFANLLFAALSLLITWRMTVGSEEFFSAPFKQSSMILKIPLWQGMMVVTAFMAFLSAVCVFTLYRSAREALGSGEPEPAS